MWETCRLLQVSRTTAWRQKGQWSLYETIQSVIIDYVKPFNPTTVKFTLQHDPRATFLRGNLVQPCVGNLQTVISQSHDSMEAESYIRL